MTTPTKEWKKKYSKDFLEMRSYFIKQGITETKKKIKEMIDESWGYLDSIHGNEELKSKVNNL